MDNLNARRRIKRELTRGMKRKMTDTEVLLWQHLRASRLDGLHFRRQEPIYGFVADFYHHASFLDVEIDGGVHERQIEYDRERDAILATKGIRVLRIPAERVENDIKGVLREIQQAVCLKSDSSPEGR